MNPVIKKGIYWLIYILILVALVWGVPKALVYVLKTDYPMASITSGSMWPALKQGDLVLIKGINSKDDIKVGDIIVYQNPSTDSTGSGQVPGFTIHRVERLKENTLITKGDANNVSDSPIKYEDVIGKAVRIKNRVVKLPYLGKLGILVQGIYKND